MHVVLVNYGRENLGLEYLSAVLKQDGVRVSLVNHPGFFSVSDNVWHSPLLQKIFDSTPELIARIIACKPDVVAFSVYSVNYQWACSVARAVKEALAVPIVFGGAHPTLVPEVVLENQWIDAVVRGEGEAALLDLVRAWSARRPISEIQNVACRHNGRIAINAVRPLIDDLDALPFPDKELFRPEVRLQDNYLTVSSRGCVFSCSFCSESFSRSLYGRSCFRKRSSENMLRELELMTRRYRSRAVHFGDSIFCADRAWVMTFLPEYKRRIGLPFFCHGHVAFLDFKIAKLLKDSGCYKISVGVQSFNQEIRRRWLNRRETDREIDAALDACDDVGLRAEIDLIMGLPGEREEELERAA